MIRDYMNSKERMACIQEPLCEVMVADEIHRLQQIERKAYRILKILDRKRSVIERNLRILRFKKEW